VKSGFIALTFATGSVLLLLAGCASVGESKFACPGRPPGVHCMTTTEVYEATQSSDYVEPTSPRVLGGDPKSAAKRRAAEAKKRQSERQSIPPSTREAGAEVAALMPGTDKPVPIRTPAQIMRVWLAPWRDAHDVAHGGGYDWIEITSRRWAFGGDGTTVEPTRVFSIQPVGAHAPSWDTKESVGKESSAQSAREGSSERSKPTHSLLPMKEPSNESSNSGRAR
jgi:conjugal transfer pilus assembly protein TraV